MKKELSEKSMEITNLNYSISFLKNKKSEVKYETKTDYIWKCQICEIDEIKEKLEFSDVIEYFTTFFALYIIITTIISIFKNNILRTDLYNFFVSLINIVVIISKNIYKLSCSVAAVAENLTVLYWIIVVVMILIIIFMSALAFYLIIRQLIKFLKDKWKWDKFQTVLTISFAGIIVHLTDVIDYKQFLNVNCLSIYLTLIIISIVFRVIKHI